MGQNIEICSKTPVGLFNVQLNVVENELRIMFNLTALSKFLISEFYSF